MPVRRVLAKLGADLRDARRRRRISTAIMAERAGVSRTTLGKIERGNHGVSIGSYATVLFVLGMENRLADLVDVASDTVGLDIEEECLPQRIRSRRRQAPAKND